MTKQRELTSVMFIDNNEIDNFINKKICESCGVTNILTFTSTSTALQYLTHLTEIPQLIFLSIRFPIMDSFEFLDKLDKLKIDSKQLDIFILSASIDPADKQKAKEKNCRGFIDKPLTAEKLLAQLNTTKI